MAEERVQRRLAAIVAADVVGYSRLMGADEEGTRARFNAHLDELIEPAIQARRGRIVKTTGDGLLVEFASVVDAVQCAVDVQTNMVGRNTNEPGDRRIEFRIGVNLGDVIIEGDDIHGDGVNVAARLEALADPGGVVVSGMVHEAVRAKLDFEFDDLGPQEVKNIAEPVPAFRVLPEGQTAVPSRKKASSRWQIHAIAAAVVILVAAGGIAWWQPWVPDVEPASIDKMAYKLPDKPSIAVLHFVNMSDDPKQEHFSDGLTEDIITDLSKISGLLVISRTSTLKYKGKPAEIRQVAEELGVQYVLEGSVRRADDKLRITAQLIDGISGSHVWAQRYDRNIQDVFAVQDDVAHNVVTKMAVRLEEGEQDRLIRKHTTNVEANEAYLRGLATMLPPRRETLPVARKLFEKAIELDPRFAGGYAGLSWIYGFTVQLGISKSPKNDIAEVLRLARKAVSLDDTMAKSHTALANAYWFMGEYDKAVTAIERAVKVEPGYSLAHMLHGRFLVSAGRAAEGINPIQRAIRMSPRNSSIVLQLGRAYRAAGQFDKAIATLEQFLARRRGTSSFGLSQLAAAQMQLGQEVEARATVAKLLKVMPGYSVTAVKKRVRFKHREERDRLLNSLQKAGLPERPPLKLPNKPSVAVLPFTNMSGDTKQEYFSDGITEDIITDLSQVSGLFVVARNSSFKYKGKSVDVRNVARDLGVGHVLEGSVRRAGDTLRITAQLIDGKTGNHVWAERYDRAGKDVFLIQDEIAGKVVAELAVTLKADEQERLFRRHTNSPDAYEAFLRARRLLGVSRDPEVRSKRRTLLERVVELDPTFAGGYAGLSFTYSRDLRYQRGASRKDYIQRALELAEKAISLDDTLGYSYVALGNARLMNHEHDLAIAAMRRAAQVQPSYANAHRFLGFFLHWAGQGNEAAMALKTAQRLDPKDRGIISHLGMAYFTAGRYEDTIISLEPAYATRARKGQNSLCFLAAAYAATGQVEKARAAMKAFLKKHPKRTLSNYKHPRLYKRKEDLDRYLNLLRKAGMPE